MTVKRVELCPVCGKPLKVEYDAGHYIVWCPYGPCSSYAANAGSVGKTLEEAEGKLLERIAKEKDPNDEVQNCS